MSRALLALGSNLGDRRATLDGAIERIAALEPVRLLRQSAWLATAPVGGPSGQDAFLNGAVLIETVTPPRELLKQLQDVERALGRRRHERWSARTLDIDLLLYDDLILGHVGPSEAGEAEAELIVPHPRLAFRRFALEPACQVAGDMRHPVGGGSLARLLRHLDESPPVLAVASDSALREPLLNELAQALTSAGRPVVRLPVPSIWTGAAEGSSCLMESAAAGSAPRSSAGSLADRAIRWIENVAGQLGEAARLASQHESQVEPRGPSPVVLIGGWLPEAAAWMRIAADNLPDGAEATQRVIEAYRRAAASTPSPRATIVLADGLPVDGLWPAAWHSAAELSSGAATSQEHLSPGAAALARLLAPAGSGGGNIERPPPPLWLATHDPSAALREALAVVAAAWPD